MRLPATDPVFFTTIDRALAPRLIAGEILTLDARQGAWRCRASVALVEDAEHCLIWSVELTGHERPVAFRFWPQLVAWLGHLATLDGWQVAGANDPAL